jgi:hypothetical protein
MRRAKHPYTATSSALVIRHAVSIDERRAKFRQDLIGLKREDAPPKTSKVVNGRLEVPDKSQQAKNDGLGNTRYRRTSIAKHGGRGRSMEQGKHTLGVSPARSLDPLAEDDGRSATSAGYSIPPRAAAFDIQEQLEEEEEADEARPQDIQEIWFSGGHGDIGGGWTPSEGEVLLSHIPLVWMVREAQRAGLRFDPEKVAEMNCGWNVDYSEEDGGPSSAMHATGVPQVNVIRSDSWEKQKSNGKQPVPGKEQFHKHLHRAATEATVHDCLTFKGGLGASAVMAWNFMEYLPFRRMDLQKDSTWKSIRWPLPMGEVRDIPDSALIHTSVLRRMETDSKYRPGNLIIGGGGRGVRNAPKKYGIGEWEIVKDIGDPIGECMVRKKHLDKSPKPDDDKDFGGTV